MSRPAPNGHPQLTPSDQAILWVARLEGLTPTEHRILLTLVMKFELKPNAHGPGWAVNASRNQLWRASGVSKASLSNAYPAIKRFISVESGNIGGDYNTWIFPEFGSKKGGGSNFDLGQKMTQVKPGSKTDLGQNLATNQEKIPLSPVYVSNPIQGEGPPPLSKPAKPEKAARKLWPAEQLPREALRLREKYAEWWTTILHSPEPPFGAVAEIAAADPSAEPLLSKAFRFIGGATCIHDCRKRPKEASFKRDEFVKYLCNNDPAYEAAVSQAIAESLEDAPLRTKARAARSP